MTLPNVGPNAGTEIYNEAVGKIAAGQLPVIDLFKATSALDGVGQKPLAAELYKVWIAYNGDNPLLYAVYYNYGVALTAIRDYPAAINALRECTRQKPDFQPAYINLGRALEDIGQIGQAVKQWLALTNHLAQINGEAVSHKTTALQQIGRVLEGANSDNAAEDALKQSLDINPHQPEVIQHWISLRQRQCKWPVMSHWDRVSRKELHLGISSLSLACHSDDPMFQLARAYNYAFNSIAMPKPASRVQSIDGVTATKIRIGYISSDLRAHAVGFAMTDVVETHDRENFEIFAYYCGINRPDATQERIKNAVDHWVDITAMDDDAAAAKIAADGIDILVDLNGYTKDARTKVFARKPAPIAVNWFGFPGTMATPYHHYIIADENIIPPADEIYYSEKVLRLPCYQPNDRNRPVAEHKPTRAEAGLPEQAFVYCSFNGPQKITPRTFRRWMTILARVPNSVMWMLAGQPEANERLRAFALECGIAAERLIFAPQKPNPEHLARYPLADLFLDSLPYGAHTTAADALWRGVPIVTMPGRSFASRVCTSLVRAAGVGELSCATPEAFVELAIEFANNPEKMAATKAKLEANRVTCTLFDTPSLVGNLENLYRQMWADYKAGALPVPDLRNLDVYHQIGGALDLEHIEALSDNAYAALYRDKLKEWNAMYPLSPDSRFWREAKADAVTQGSHLSVVA
jgi:predicted O-linked N-acetylglucosamine transferase (SPINDLY family)